MSNYASRGKFNKMRNQYVNRAQGKELFQGGSALEWILARRHIMTAFQGAGVFDYVNYPPDMTLTDPPPPGMVLLTEFQCPVAQPDQRGIVRAGMTKRLNKISLALTDALNDIYPPRNTPRTQALYNAHVAAHGPPTQFSIVTIDARDYRVKTNKVKEDARRDMTEAKIKHRDELMRHYLSLEDTYQEAVREHDKKRAAAVKIFQERLSRHVLELIDNEIQSFELRKALFILDAHYASVRGGAESMSRILSLLDGVAFIDDGMDKHIEFMNTLFNQADQVQMTQTDAQKSFYLIRSIERGNAPWLKETISFHKQNKSDYQDLCEAVTLEDQNRHFERSVKARVAVGQKRAYAAEAHEDALDEDPDGPISSNDATANVVAGPGKGKNKKKGKWNKGKKPPDPNKHCSFCKNNGKEGIGHTDAECWHKHACKHCGKAGHSPQWCPNVKKADRGGKANSTSTPSNSAKQVKIKSNFAYANDTSSDDEDN